MEHPIDAELVSEETNGAIAIRTSDAIALTREPTVVLAEAVKAAQALKQVLDAKPDKVMMNGEQYIENDDWQTIAHFYGISARIDDEKTKAVQFGDVSGFEAVAEAVTRDGRVVGRAKSMCLDDEEKWSDRTKYDYHYVLKNGQVVDEAKAQEAGTSQWEWEAKDPSKPIGPGNSRPKKQKVATGTTAVPKFQLLSMAQTRASSKVMRMVLGFVPVLAGFKSTPAEELDGQTERVSNAKPVGGGSTAATNKTAAASNEVTDIPTNPPATPKPAATKAKSTTTTKAAQGVAQAAVPAEPAAAPPAPAAPAPTPDPTASMSGQAFTIVKLNKLNEGTNQRGPWVLYGIETVELGPGVNISTLDAEQAREALAARKEGRKLILTYETEVKGRFTNRRLKEIARPLHGDVEREPGDESELEVYDGPDQSGEDISPQIGEVFKGTR